MSCPGTPCHSSARLPTKFADAVLRTEGEIGQFSSQTFIAYETSVKWRCANQTQMLSGKLTLRK